MRKNKIYLRKENVPPHALTVVEDFVEMVFGAPNCIGAFPLFPNGSLKLTVLFYPSMILLPITGSECHLGFVSILLVRNLGIYLFLFCTFWQKYPYFSHEINLLRMKQKPFL